MYYGNNEWSEKGPAQCDGRIGFGNSVPDILLVLRVLIIKAKTIRFHIIKQDMVELIKSGFMI